MSTFSDFTTKLGAARAEADAASLAVSRARAELERARRELAAARRSGGERGAALEKAVGAAEARLAAARATHGERRTGAEQLLGQFAALADPTEQLAELSDRTPILLLPLRLETRFHSGQGRDGAPINELWIRVYPDECQIDAFEPLLRDSELDNLRAFWIATFRAGRVEAQERGAWASLVGGLGSGRAQFAVQTFAPTNLALRPTKTAAQDVVLVIVPETSVTSAERTALFTYWKAVWAADGNAQQAQNARADLETAMGAARAAVLIQQFAPDPAGWEPPAPYARADVQVTCTVLELPTAPLTTGSSWTRAPTAAALPDRLVALLYRGGEERARVIGNPIRDGLAVTPDPTLPVDEQIGIENDDLELNDDLAWVADFERAVAVGMGFRIALNAAEARAGFDRLLVLGVRLSADDAATKKTLEQLIEHQRTSKQGYGLVPQGSPTNNTESGSSVHTWIDDPDASFDRVFKGREAYTPTSDELLRRDGEWLAEALAIDDELVKTLPHAAGTDQAEVRAMNVALWNGTLGYGLEELLAPLVSRADIGATRQFFTRLVSGRGPLPAVRVGRQPYGVLPVLAFSRFQSGRTRGIEGKLAPSSDYVDRLHGVLARMSSDFDRMAADVAHVGKPGDAHQTLLDIVGLHPGSVEYHQRYAESLDQLYNKLTLEGGAILGGLLAGWLATRGRQLLAQLGADPDAHPSILEKFFYGTSALLGGPVVNDVPLSETAAVRAYAADGKNYIEWLATSSLDVIRRQDFGGKPEPLALLYLMLRHSLLLGQWDAGVRLLETHGLASDVTRREPSFIHVQQAAAGGQSKYAPLIQTAPAITGDATTTLADYVLRPAVFATAAETEDLREIVAALGRFARTPTARLERLFAEHVDTVSYRLDAWKTAFATLRLRELRGESEQRSGLRLGAFGLLENLKPKRAALEPVELPPERAAVFQRPGDAPLQQDPSNAGHILAPALNQAAAAAILKNAYRVNASSENPDAMAVNLSSNRVSRALAVLEGVRNGQPLAALFGYRFERGLHDEHSLAEVDKFIYPLRAVFPLVANQLTDTKTNADIRLLEARNVLDGQKLLDHVRVPANRSYPFGLPLGAGVGQVPPASTNEQTAINTEVDRLLDLADALGDLMLAESVYQVVQGNFERAAAVSKGLLEGALPPAPEIVKTPRAGLSLEHRVALHLDPAVPLTSPSAVPMTARAKAEAPLNRWLFARLPQPGNIAVKVTYETPALAPQTVFPTLLQLGLQPLDLLYMGDLELEQAMTALDDRIVQVVRYGTDAHPGMKVTIQYTEPVAGKTTLFELASLVRSLRVVVLKSRPLVGTDLMPPLDTASDPSVVNTTELAARVQVAITALGQRRDALVLLQTDASPLDAYAKLVSEELLRVALHGTPNTGSAAVHGDLGAIYGAVAAKIDTALERLDARAADYLALMGTWPTLTDETSRFAMLKRAELCVRAAGTLSPPPLAANFKLLVEGEKLAFDGCVTQLRALKTWVGTRIADFVAAVGVVAPLVNQCDPTPFTIDDQVAALGTLRDVLVGRVTALAEELTRRCNEATALVTAALGTSDPEAGVQQLLAASKLVLGDEMRMIPRFDLPATRRAELTQCFNGSTALLTDLIAGGRRFPVDDWLYGVARVRERLAAWENAAVLAETFGATVAELTPLQLPFVTADRWAALEFDTAAALKNDRLLYTAHFSVAFDPSKTQCGLLLDAWPEIVPARTVSSGLTFHFDRPNSEPPQALLLAVPPVLRGNWRWDDLVATVLETFDMAKARAVEPSQVDGSAYAQLLPATVMAVTLYGITISTNLAQNIHLYERIEASS